MGATEGKGLFRQDIEDKGQLRFAGFVISGALLDSTGVERVGVTITPSRLRNIRGSAEFYRYLLLRPPYIA